MTTETIRDTVYCFIDTNVLIHFQTFDEVNWPTVLHATNVYLILAPVVMAELDRFKDDSSNGWRQTRVRTLLSKLKALLAGAKPGEEVQLASGLYVMDIAVEPLLSDWPAMGLDPMVNDDRFLASVTEFENLPPSKAVLVVSNDFPVQRKAARLGIEVVEPDGVIGRIERLSPERSTIQRLESDIQALKKTIPELRFHFWEDGDAVSMVIRLTRPSKGGWRSDDDIATEIHQKRQELTLIVGRAKVGGVPQAKVTRFSRMYEEYVERLEVALKAQRSRDFGPRCELAFVLQNVGSVPALDVKIDLEFPQDSFILGVSHEGEIFDQVMIPYGPTPEWTKVSNILSPLLIHPPNQPPEQPKPKGPLYDFDGDRNAVVYRHPKFFHRDRWNMDPIIARLPPTTAGGFQIGYYIRADNLVDPIEGQLNVVWERTG